MSKTLLLADDSVTMQKVVGITFANEDINLVMVDNGDEALNRARQVLPDVVLADVGMPGLDGYALCAALKSEPTLSHVKVILLTGTFDNYDESRASEVGADAHVAKPFEAQVLVDRVRQLLAAAADAPPAAAPAPAAPAAPELAETSDDFDLDFGDLDFESSGSGAAPPAPVPSPEPPARPTATASPPHAADPEALGQTVLLGSSDGDLLGGSLDEPWDTGGSAPVAPDPLEAASSQEDLAGYDQTLLMSNPAELGAAPDLGPPAVSPPPVPRASEPEEPLDLSEPEEATSPPMLGEELWEMSDRETEQTEPDAATDFQSARPAPPLGAGDAPWAEPLEDTPPPARPSAAPRPAPRPSAPAVNAPAVNAPDREAIREALEKVAWDALGNLSEQVIQQVVAKVEQIAWEVVPVMTERLIQAEIDKLKR